MNSKIPVNVTIDPGSLSIPASPIFQKEKNTYAAKFSCQCGCTFWADDKDIKFPSYSVIREYAPGVKLTECPECGEQVVSCFPAVPREKIFVD